jgi:hypothetical protein
MAIGIRGWGRGNFTFRKNMIKGKNDKLTIINEGVAFDLDEGGPLITQITLIFGVSVL